MTTSSRAFFLVLGSVLVVSAADAQDAEQCFCDQPHSLSFGTESVGPGAGIFAASIGVSEFDGADPCEGPETCAAAGVLEVRGTQGETVTTDVFVNINTQVGGLQGWGLSMEYDDQGSGSSVVEAEFRGVTAGAALEFGGKVVRVVVGPEDNDGVQGVAAAVVLSLVVDTTVPVGETSVL